MDMILDEYARTTDKLKYGKELCMKLCEDFDQSSIKQVEECIAQHIVNDIALLSTLIVDCISCTTMICVLENVWNDDMFTQVTDVDVRSHLWLCTCEKLLSYSSDAVNTDDNVSDMNGDRQDNVISAVNLLVKIWRHTVVRSFVIVGSIKNGCMYERLDKMMNVFRAYVSPSYGRKRRRSMIHVSSWTCMQLLDLWNELSSVVTTQHPRCSPRDLPQLLVVDYSALTTIDAFLSVEYCSRPSFSSPHTLARQLFAIRQWFDLSYTNLYKLAFLSALRAVRSLVPIHAKLKYNGGFSWIARATTALVKLPCAVYVIEKQLRKHHTQSDDLLCAVRSLVGYSSLVKQPIDLKALSLRGETATLWHENGVSSVPKFSMFDLLVDTLTTTTNVHYYLRVCDGDHDDEIPATTGPPLINRSSLNEIASCRVLEENGLSLRLPCVLKSEQSSFVTCTNEEHLREYLDKMFHAVTSSVNEVNSLALWYIIDMAFKPDLWFHRVQSFVAIQLLPLVLNEKSVVLLSPVCLHAILYRISGADVVHILNGFGSLSTIAHLCFRLYRFADIKRANAQKTDEYKVVPKMSVRAVVQGDNMDLWSVSPWFDISVLAHSFVCFVHQRSYSWRSTTPPPPLVGTESAENPRIYEGWSTCEKYLEHLPDYTQVNSSYWEGNTTVKPSITPIVTFFGKVMSSFQHCVSEYMKSAKQVHSIDNRSYREVRQLLNIDSSRISWNNEYERVPVGGVTAENMSENQTLLDRTDAMCHWTRKLQHLCHDFKLYDTDLIVTLQAQVLTCLDNFAVTQLKDLVNAHESRKIEIVFHEYTTTLDLLIRAFPTCSLCVISHVVHKMQHEVDQNKYPGNPDTLLQPRLPCRNAKLTANFFAAVVEFLLISRTKQDHRFPLCAAALMPSAFNSLCCQGAFNNQQVEDMRPCFEMVASRSCACVHIDQSNVYATLLKALSNASKYHVQKHWASWRDFDRGGLIPIRMCIPSLSSSRVFLCLCETVISACSDAVNSVMNADVNSTSACVSRIADGGPGLETGIRTAEAVTAGFLCLFTHDTLASQFIEFVSNDEVYKRLQRFRDKWRNSVADVSFAALCSLILVYNTIMVCNETEIEECIRVFHRQCVKHQLPACATNVFIAMVSCLTRPTDFKMWNFDDIIGSTNVPPALLHLGNESHCELFVLSESNNRNGGGGGGL